MTKFRIKMSEANGLYYAQRRVLGFWITMCEYTGYRAEKRLMGFYAYGDAANYIAQQKD